MRCVNYDGNIHYYDDEGRLHREDGPAIVFNNGGERWFRHGHLHREDGPAVVEPDGYMVWYQNDLRHREDGPARVYPDGRKEWCRLGRQLKLVPGS